MHSRGIYATFCTSRTHISRVALSTNAHDSLAKEIADSRKPLPTRLQYILEERVLISALLLSLLNGSDSRIMWTTNRAFHCVVNLIKTTLVEGMFA
jgi:hypothetical protein